MPKLNTTVKSVRVENEKLAELEQKLAGRSINSWLNEAITEFLEGKPRVNPDFSELPYGIDKKDLDDMSTMAGFVGGNMRIMIHLLDIGLNEGVFEVRDGKLIAHDLTLRTDDFKEVCHDMGLDCQKVLDEATKKLRKGIL